MKLRSGKYTSKDDLLNSLEEQVKRNEEIDVEDLIFYNSPTINFQMVINSIVFSGVIVCLYILLVQ